jgi:hypothetical protein
MNSPKLITGVSWFAIAVLVAHAVRGWAMQLRWVSAVIELAAAAVIGWQWWLLTRQKPALGMSTRAQDT